MTLGFCDCNQGRLPCTCKSGLRPVAFIYTCRNPGQVALLWSHQPPPFGHGWIDVKRVGLVREDEVEALLRSAYLKGFEESGEGWNAEYPGDVTERPGFNQRMTDTIAELLK